MYEKKPVIAVYGSHREVEKAIQELQRAGVDMRILCNVGKGAHTDEDAAGYFNTGDGMKYWGKTGTLCRGFWGLLFESAFFAIPGLIRFAVHQRQTHHFRLPPRPQTSSAPASCSTGQSER